MRPIVLVRGGGFYSLLGPPGSVHGTILDPDKQLRFAQNVPDCPVVDFDAAHMAMISQPEALAQLLNGIAADP